MKLQKSPSHPTFALNCFCIFVKGNIKTLIIKCMEHHQEFHHQENGDKT